LAHDKVFYNMNNVTSSWLCQSIDEGKVCGHNYCITSFAITLTCKIVSDGKKKVMGQFESDDSLITIAHIIKL